MSYSSDDDEDSAQQLPLFNPNGTGWTGLPPDTPTGQLQLVAHNPQLHPNSSAAGALAVQNPAAFQAVYSSHSRRGYDSDGEAPAAAYPHADKRQRRDDGYGLRGDDAAEAAAAAAFQVPLSMTIGDGQSFAYPHSGVAAHLRPTVPPSGDMVPFTALFDPESPVWQRQPEFHNSNDAPAFGAGAASSSNYNSSHAAGIARQKAAAANRPSGHRHAGNDTSSQQLAAAASASLPFEPERYQTGMSFLAAELQDPPSHGPDSGPQSLGRVPVQQSLEPTGPVSMTLDSPPLQSVSDKRASSTQSAIPVLSLPPPSVSDAAPAAVPAAAPAAAVSIAAPPRRPLDIGQDRRARPASSSANSSWNGGNSGGVSVAAAAAVVAPQHVPTRPMSASAAAAPRYAPARPTSAEPSSQRSSAAAAGAPSSILAWQTPHGGPAYPSSGAMSRQRELASIRSLPVSAAAPSRAAEIKWFAQPESDANSVEYKWQGHAKLARSAATRAMIGLENVTDDTEDLYAKLDSADSEAKAQSSFVEGQYAPLITKTKHTYHINPQVNAQINGRDTPWNNWLMYHRWRLFGQANVFAAVQTSTKHTKATHAKLMSEVTIQHRLLRHLYNKNKIGNTVAGFIRPPEEVKELRHVIMTPPVAYSHKYHKHLIQPLDVQRIENTLFQLARLIRPNIPKDLQSEFDVAIYDAMYNSEGGDLRQLVMKRIMTVHQVAVTLLRRRCKALIQNHMMGAGRAELNSIAGLPGSRITRKHVSVYLDQGPDAFYTEFGTVDDTVATTIQAHLMYPLETPECIRMVTATALVEAFSYFLYYTTTALYHVRNDNALALTLRTVSLCLSNINKIHDNLAGQAATLRYTMFTGLVPGPNGEEVGTEIIPLLAIQNTLNQDTLVGKTGYAKQDLAPEKSEAYDKGPGLTPPESLIRYMTWTSWDENYLEARLQDPKNTSTEADLRWWRLLSAYEPDFTEAYGAPLPPPAAAAVGSAPATTDTRASRHLRAEIELLDLQLAQEVEASERRRDAAVQQRSLDARRDAELAIASLDPRPANAGAAAAASSSVQRGTLRQSSLLGYMPHRSSERFQSGRTSDDARAQVAASAASAAPAVTDSAADSEADGDELEMLSPEAVREEMLKKANNELEWGEYELRKATRLLKESNAELEAADADYKAAQSPSAAEEAKQAKDTALAKSRIATSAYEAWLAQRNKRQQKVAELKARVFPSQPVAGQAEQRVKVEAVKMEPIEVERLLSRASEANALREKLARLQEELNRVTAAQRSSDQGQDSALAAAHQTRLSLLESQSSHQAARAQLDSANEQIREKEKELEQLARNLNDANRSLESKEKAVKEAEDAAKTAKEDLAKLNTLRMADLQKLETLEAELQSSSSMSAESRRQKQEELDRARRGADERASQVAQAARSLAAANTTLEKKKKRRDTTAATAEQAKLQLNQAAVIAKQTSSGRMVHPPRWPGDD